VPEEWCPIGGPSFSPPISLLASHKGISRPHRVPLSELRQLEAIACIDAVVAACPSSLILATTSAGCTNDALALSAVALHVAVAAAVAAGAAAVAAVQDVAAHAHSRVNLKCCWSSSLLAPLEL